MTVQIIQPTEYAATRLKPRPAKLRVAAYCRVSTDMQEQKSSYEAQCRHYTSYIREHSDWTLAGIYAEEGISGTQARRRPEFLRMIADCESGHIDLVITKSISRFARNTLDCLNYIRRLKELGIPVVFEKESINTMEAAGEVLITILASLAQQESASISQNVKMGIRYVMREGRGRVNYTQFLGYTQGPTKGSLVIVPDEAEVVRRIYRAFLDGYSPALIASRLEADAIPTPTGRKRWHASTIASILRNEKYCGDLLLQKYFTQDYLTHKVVRNEGQLPQYLVEDHHEPIIPKEVFRRVQDERLRRSRLRNDPAKLRFGNRKALAGRLFCARCGRMLKRCVRGRLGEAEWHCCDRSQAIPAGTVDWHADDCSLRGMKETEVQTLVLEAFNRLPLYRPTLEEARSQLLAHTLAPLDRLISCAEDLLAQLRRTAEESVAQAAEEPVAPGEGEGLPAAGEDNLAHQKILQVEHHVEALRALRATYANHEMQLLLLIQLADQLPPAPQPQPAAPAPSPQPACTTAADFYHRTRHLIPDALRNETGRLSVFDDALVTRYLDHVMVADEGCEVVFKAGVRVRLRVRRRLATAVRLDQPNLCDS